MHGKSCLLQTSQSWIVILRLLMRHARNALVMSQQVVDNLSAHNVVVFEACCDTRYQV